MILDKLENFSRYTSLNELFPLVSQFLQEHDLTKMAPGKTEIKGNDLFVNIQDCQPKGKNEAKLESHRKMIDIQIPLSHEEIHGHSILSLPQDVAYDEENDISFYTYPSDNYLTVQPGEFVIYFPQDGHAPAISAVPFRKAIFKVKI